MKPVFIYSTLCNYCVNLIGDYKDFIQENFECVCIDADKKGRRPELTSIKELFGIKVESVPLLIVPGETQLEVFKSYNEIAQLIHGASEVPASPFVPLPGATPGNSVGGGGGADTGASFSPGGIPHVKDEPPPFDPRKPIVQTGGKLGEEESAKALQDCLAARKAQDEALKKSGPSLTPEQAGHLFGLNSGGL